MDMIILKTTIALILILASGLSFSSTNEIERLSSTISEAQVLIETRLFLRELNEQSNSSIEIDKEYALEVAARVEEIATDGRECVDELTNNILRSQAYALVAGINGVLSKESHNIKLGRKSYHYLSKARELDPNNIDAIKGQAVALKMILSKKWHIRKLAAISLGINLQEAKKDLIKDLRRFDRADLARLADQLQR